MSSQESNIDQLLKARAEIDKELRRHKTSLTILFTDIVGSTAYFDRYGDTVGFAMLQRHAKLAANTVSEFRGTVIKTIGDSVMAEFPEPAFAVRAAVELQHHLLRLNQTLPERERVQLRVGINHGPAFRHGSDIYGDAINLAARITKRTAPAQILISRSVRDAITLDPELRCTGLGKLTLEGKAEKEDIFEVIWTDTATYADLRAHVTAAFARGELMSPGVRLDDFLHPGRAPEETPAESPIGQTISHYRILEKIGEGGMGEVYKAQDTHLDRPVALKLLPADLVQDERRRRRFYDEARSASALNHPNIATIYEVGEADGTHFIAMEFVEGNTVRRLLSRGRLALKRALDIAIQVAEGLSRAHARGVVHRDIKPENIMVTPDGLVKILDFGLAKRTEAALLGPEGASTLPSATAPGTVLGTVAYMSPEQAQGNPVDTRSDIFTFGAVLYEMLTGQQPFQGDSSVDVLHAIVRTEPRPLAQSDPTLPLELVRILEKALAKDAEERYQGIKDLSIDLKRLKRDTESGVAAVAPVAARPAPRWWLAAAAGLAVVAVLAAAYLFVRTRPAEAPSQTYLIKPLTSFVGMEWGATWSPDASFVAYAHTAPGPMNIFVMATAGGDPIRLTDNAADDVTPRWSPDGRWLAFLSDRGTGTNVYLIPPLGGVERKLVETNIPWLQGAVAALLALGAVPWSPDASELLFSRLHPSGEIVVWKINLSTGEQTQLTQPPPGAADFYATWSFDGKRIAFTRNQGGKNSLWLMDAQGGEPALLLGDQYENMQPAWAADSQRLVFVSDRGGPRNLWEIEIGSGRLRQVTSGPGTAILPAISPTGRVAYTPYSHQVDLYWGPVDQPQEQHQRLTAHTFNNFNGRVAPDGQQVVYSSDRTGNYELWLLDRRTGAERQLTDHPAMDALPDWSPDGREIVFLSNREGTFLQAWVLEIESGRVRRLSEKSRPISFEPHFGGPRWSPDGKAIGFIAAGEKGEALWVVDPQGKKERSVLSGVMGFDWYRTSRHVVYTGRASDGTLEMRVADLETGKEAILHRGPKAELVVARDGRGVAYVHAASHFDMQLHVLRLAPPASPGELPRPVGEPRQLTHGEGAFHIHNGGWSPDSKAIVYTRDADSGNVHVIENYK